MKNKMLENVFMILLMSICISINIFVITWRHIDQDPWFTFLLPIIALILCSISLISHTFKLMQFLKKEKYNEDV